MQPSDPQAPVLAFTGERFTPECVREIWYEHWHRYAFASSFVKDKVVVDAACGEGYGSHLLAQTARSVCGFDIDTDSIEHARRRYLSANVAANPAVKLEYHQASVLQLPLADNSVDVITSFETLEHLAEQQQMLSEFARILKADGLLLISTPDKHQYSDLTGYNNPDHVRELYRHEFIDLLSAHFRQQRLYAQKLLFCSAIWEQDQQQASYTIHHHADNVIAGTSQMCLPPLYYIAICSQQSLPSSQALDLLTDQEEAMYRHYNQQVGENIACGEQVNAQNEKIRHLQAEIAQLKQRLQQTD